MSYIKTQCTKCGWEGYVDERNLLRQCPSNYCDGSFVASYEAPPARPKPKELLEEEDRLFDDLFRRWQQVPCWWEVEGDKGPTRRVRPRPSDWSDSDVRALAEFFGFDPFPGPGDPAKVKRRLGDDGRDWMPAPPQLTAAKLPPAPPSPSAERVARTEAAIRDFARRKDADPVTAFVAARPVVDPWGDDDPFADN